MDFVGRAAWDFLHLGGAADEEKGDFAHAAALAERHERMGEFMEGNAGEDDYENGQVPYDAFQAAHCGGGDGDQDQ